jgi:hypothetical protein
VGTIFAPSFSTDPARRPFVKRTLFMTVIGCINDCLPRPDLSVARQFGTIDELCSILHKSFGFERSEVFVPLRVVLDTRKLAGGARIGAISNIFQASKIKSNKVKV